MSGTVTRNRCSVSQLRDDFAFARALAAWRTTSLFPHLNCAVPQSAMRRIRPASVEKCGIERVVRVRLYHSLLELRMSECLSRCNKPGADPDPGSAQRQRVARFRDTANCISH